MLEGLEVTEQRFYLLNSIIDYRIEAEYFDKRFLRVDELFKNINHTLFLNIANYENGQAYNSNEFSETVIEQGIKVAKIGDVTQKRINENWEWVSISEFLERKGHYLVDDDILMTLTGDPPDVGKVNLFKDNSIKSTWNQRVAKISLKKEQFVFLSPRVLFIILRNKYCREQLERYAKGIRQRNLGVECVEKLKIPILSKEFQLGLDELVVFSYVKVKKSRQLYVQAEELILQEIGFADFKPSTENINEKTFKESFLLTDRLDAEYYQKKYEDYLELIKKYSNGFDWLESLCTLKDANFIPKDRKEYKYIELADIGNSGSIMGCTIAEGSKLPTRARRKVNTNDVIVSSIEGSLNSCALATENYNDAICSTGFYVINSLIINSETLLVLFKSEPMQQILKQNCSGTILTAINKLEFLHIPIPLISGSVQKEIQEKVKESFALKKQSEQLLEVAKKAVEIVIEDNEETAMEYIKKA